MPSPGLMPRLCASAREETLEFAVGGDFVDREGELIEVEVWDYHWCGCAPCPATPGPASKQILPITVPSLPPQG